MIKTTLAALLVSVSLAGVAAPAAAAQWSLSGDDEISDSERYLEDAALTLRAQGYDVQSVEDWGRYVRAFVILEDGREAMQLFHGDTLQPVSAVN